MAAIITLLRLRRVYSTEVLLDTDRLAEHAGKVKERAPAQCAMRNAMLGGEADFVL